MDISLLSDPVTVAPNKGLGFRPIANSSVSLFDPLFSDPSAALHISTPIVDALAPPRVRPGQGRLRRAGIRKKSRTSRSCDGDDSGEDNVVFSGYGDGFYGGPGGSWGGSRGGGGGSGGKGWNSDRSEEQDWDESSWWFSSSSMESAFAFLYEVIYWIVLPYCMHFAFMMVVRILADLVAGGERGTFL